MFQQATVIGLGQIGGSVALNLKRKRLAKVVVGVGRRAANLKKAKSLRAIDRWTTDPIKGVAGSDLVILAAPVVACIETLKKIGRHLKPGCLVTDVASTKQELIKAGEKFLSRDISFVGGHPIAGMEKGGMAAATLDLFRGKRTIIVPSRRSQNKAIQRTALLWKRMGAHVTIMRPGLHDGILALVSHLPHMVAYSLVETLAHSDPYDARKFVGGGFLDFTRITSSPPEMWRDIGLTNRREILTAMRSFLKEFRKLYRMVARRRAGALEKFFAAAKVFRDTAVAS